MQPTYAAVSENYIAKEKRIGDPTRLILVDEADRLKIVCLEKMRAMSFSEVGCSGIHRFQPY
jgi:DNA transposition AAA+ family ATPase